MALSLRVLDLFSGIGGFSLGLERAGMKPVAFCEIEPYCRAVLGKRWPNVPVYHDVRELTGEKLRADGIVADVICGGFPCQDISCAGKREGIDGKRSGLWGEYARIIGEIRPAYAIVENVAALAIRGLDRVLGDLAALGYDAEWHCIPASAVGAPHRRDRIWIVAYANSAEWRAHTAPCGQFQRQNSVPQRQEGPSGFAGRSYDVANTSRLFRNGGEHNGRSDCESTVTISQSGNGGDATHMAHTERWRLPARHEQHHEGNAVFLTPRSREGAWDHVGETWRTEPRLDRVAYGVPNQMDRCVALGNAVVPQIPEIIGRAIIAAQSELARAA